MPETILGVGPFLIKEMTGEERTINLAGRALPYRPYTLTGSQRVELTWYPGNPVATAQVLGAAEDRTSINGIWKDRFIGEDNETIAATLDGGQLGSVVDLVAAVDSFRRKGQLLEVTWQRIARRGFITNFTQAWENLHDCAWDIEFTWISNAIDGEVAITTREIDLKGVTDETTAGFINLYNAANSGISKLKGVADDINSAMGSLQESVSSVEDNLLNMVDGALSPLDAARRAVATLESVGSGSFAIGQRMYSVVYQSLTATFSVVLGRPDIDAVSVGAAVGAANGRANIVRQSQKMKHNAARNRARLIRAIDPELTRTFFARADQDLRDVSIAFFGTADEWQKIAEFNSLSSSRLRAGQVVLVPASFNSERRC